MKLFIYTLIFIFGATLVSFAGDPPKKDSSGFEVQLVDDATPVVIDNDTPVDDELRAPSCPIKNDQGVTMYYAEYTTIWTLYGSTQVYTGTCQGQSGSFNCPYMTGQQASCIAE